MEWSDVGNWLKDNAAEGVGLIGSLLTGNIPGAIAAGAAMVGGATGTTDPDLALKALQSDPNVMLELKRIQLEQKVEINRHLEAIELAKLKDKQEEHKQAQLTVRNSDKQEGNIKWVRPTQAFISLCAGIVYVFTAQTPDWVILSTLLALPFSYAGLRTIDKKGKLEGTVFK